MKTATPVGADFLNPGIKYTSGLDAASLTLGLILGTAGLTSRFSTFSHGTECSRSKKIGCLGDVDFRNFSISSLFSLALEQQS